MLSKKGKIAINLSYLVLFLMRSESRGIAPLRVRGASETRPPCYSLPFRLPIALANEGVQLRPFSVSIHKDDIQPLAMPISREPYPSP